MRRLLAALGAVALLAWAVAPAVGALCCAAPHACCVAKPVSGPRADAGRAPCCSASAVYKTAAYEVPPPAASLTVTPALAALTIPAAAYPTVVATRPAQAPRAPALDPPLRLRI